MCKLNCLSFITLTNYSGEGGGGGGGGGSSCYGLVVVARTCHGCGLPRVNLRNPHRTASISYVYIDIGEKIAGKKYWYILKGLPGPLE